MTPEESFVVMIEPPRIFRFVSNLITYYTGELHFCDDCMGKINECITELGRSE